MMGLTNPPAIYLYREYVDFRKSINGLAALVESETDLPLGSGALFLFTNRQRNKIKILYWDKTGFAALVQTSGKSQIQMTLSGKKQVFTLRKSELNRLLSGFTIIGHKSIEIHDFTMS
ncbi:IS66 family insertion sequence element accessory protein TnpB [Vibrio salinus]|uniref:IS66 family insertion sequence element accessory protein TnpB n=1 Tax=Vibrio salinus TaxID=2899784 RepID=UPI001E443B6A|nr:IS66 family insertion sequence element accessory protein TnpB [Vibrio salinus]MCE0493824.1 IS66 family insertion sequence element accessory protein TnpB [Vibrio salinus]